MVRLGVFADVHVGSVEPADRQGPLDGREDAVRGQLAAVRQQRPADDGQVGQQFGSARVVPTRLVRPARDAPATGC